MEQVFGNSSPLTGLLQSWRRGGRGGKEAEAAVLPLVYDELRSLAVSYLRKERPGHTLQPTALVHEAYLRLSGGAAPEWESRKHFFSIAARLMRQILVDHARRHLRGKRGGGVRPIPFGEDSYASPRHLDDWLAIDRALEELTKLDSRKAEAIELRYFGGLTVEETAQALEISVMTAHRDLRFAEAWLNRVLRSSQAECV
jgi:RNA polymerase sigma-70 factor (ECF subfamily)